MNERQIKRLFNLVFGNIVLAKYIYSFARIYKRNEFKVFNSEMELLEYKERGYIQKLVYRGDILNKYVLPNSGILREIRISKNIVGDVIPGSVGIIDFNLVMGQETDITSLPLSIHTVQGVVIRSVDNKQIIPPNITSISFDQCPHISGSFKIPNTIRSLEFDEIWNNKRMKLQQGDIPEGVTSLSMVGYNIADLEKQILPNSITNLKIGRHFEDIFNFDFLTSNIESLYITNGFNITRDHNLYSHHSIKQLTIDINGFTPKFQPNSFPQSLTKLSIYFYKLIIDSSVIPNSVRKLIIRFEQFDENSISKGAIPNSVVSLTLSRAVYIENLFPGSLKKLKFINDTHSQNIEHILSKTPQSLTSVTLPKSLKSKKLSILQRIKVNYK